MRKLGLLVCVALFAWGLAGKTVAVAPFWDRGSGLVGVDLGLAELIEAKLKEAGITVVPARALESFRQGQNLPRTEETWILAASTFGADYLLLGTLESLTTTRVSLSLGFLVIEGVSAQAEISLILWDVAEGKAVANLRERGTGQGQITPSFRLFLSIPWDVCAGGFRTNKTTYFRGEPVVLGFRDTTPPRTFYVVVHPVSSATPAWTSTPASSSSSDPCVTWTWDGYFGSALAEPGTYVAELWDAATSALLATRTFEIQEGFAGWALELHFGAPEFAGTAWYQALDNAINALIPKVLPFLQDGEA